MRPDQAELALADFAGRGTAWHLPVLALIAFLLFLPAFFTLPVVDRDEARFSQASRQMVETGDYIDIRLGEDTRYKKPVGIYWLQSAALQAVGTDKATEIWVYRLPSLAAAIGSVLLTYMIALSLANARVALVAATLMATTVVLGGEARIAKTDATLLLTILAAQWVLARLWMGQALDKAWPWLFWAALGLSMLVKGPVGPMVVGLTVLALSIIRRDLRWLRALRPMTGCLLFLAIVLPWYVLITLKSGNAFWAESLGRDLLGKIGEGQENHGAPPGTYLVAVWLTFWPASILLPFGLWIAWSGRRQPNILFCLAWIIPSWLVFEVTATKLIHYVLPTYPALAILSALGWLDRPDTRPPLAYVLFLGAMLLLAFVLAAVPLGYGFQWDQSLTLVWVLGVLASALGVSIVWTRMRAGDRLAPLIGFLFLSLGFSSCLFGHLARTEALWPSDQLARIHAAADLCEAPAYISVGYEEASILLRSDPRPVFRSPTEAAAEAEAADCAMVFVHARNQAGFEAATTDPAWTKTGTVDGFGLGNAKPLSIGVYQRP